MKNTIKLFMVAMILFSVSCSDDDDSNSNLDNISTVDIINPILGTVPGTATLHRDENRITVNYNTSGLTPGYAYTLWWVIWNNPQNCEIPGACDDPDFGTPELVGVDVLYATGLVVNDSGLGDFSASLSVDDFSESVNVDVFELPFVGGLHSGNTFDAEIHIVLRSHGPVIPELVDEQIGGYLGGCTTFLGVFNEIPDEVGECGDIEFAVFSPAN